MEKLQLENVTLGIRITTDNYSYKVYYNVKEDEIYDVVSLEESPLNFEDYEKIINLIRNNLSTLKLESINILNYE